jgi:hypothetical protein
MSSILDVLEKTRVFFSRFLEIFMSCEKCCVSECGNVRMDFVPVESVTIQDAVDILDIFENNQACKPSIQSESSVEKSPQSTTQSTTYSFISPGNLQQN